MDNEWKKDKENLTIFQIIKLYEIGSQFKKRKYKNWQR